MSRRQTTMDVDIRRLKQLLDERKPTVAANEPFQQSPLLNELEEAMLKNTAFRRVLFTTPQSQQVAMHLAPRTNIGWEQHRSTSQYFAVVEGSGTLYEGTTNNQQRASETPITVGSNWLVTPGTYHDVVAGADGMRLLTIYFPPNHRPGTVQMVR